MRVFALRPEGAEALEEEAAGRRLQPGELRRVRDGLRERGRVVAGRAIASRAERLAAARGELERQKAELAAKASLKSLNLSWGDDDEGS